jgi:hypothetical protein
MMLDFPPRPVHEYEIEIMLEVLASVVEGRTAVYLSAPITTGQRYVEWHRQNNTALDASHPKHRETYLREVVQPNRAQAGSLAQELRRLFAKVVIDPTVVADLPGWTQDDYRHLWARVIERYAGIVVFMNGWQYSNGCVYEFLTAQRSGATTLTENQHPLTREEGMQLIRAAMTEMRAHSLPTEFLVHVVEELARLRHDDNTGRELWAE